MNNVIHAAARFMRAAPSDIELAIQQWGFEPDVTNRRGQAVRLSDCAVGSLLVSLQRAAESVAPGVAAMCAMGWDEEICTDPVIWYCPNLLAVLDRPLPPRHIPLDLDG